MSEYKVPLEDMRFLLKEVFDAEQFWRQLNLETDLDVDTADAILEEAAKLAEQVLAPMNRESDETGCTWSQEGVTTPAGFKEAYQTYCEGGWTALSGHPAFGGMGMPKTLISPIEEMVQGSNMAFGLAPMLSSGAALALNAHGSEALKNAYLPKLYSGDWSGAMDLTEPHCGTDLGMIRTKAIPNDDDSYAITGTKIFITWGEHDMAENIVHLVLAKLPDAPEGSRGISMFLVPKFLPDAKGEVGERNAVSCGSLEKKMGIKASATCVMNYDGATGWLVGEPNKGLAAMFTMMNYERLAVGIQGLGAAEASYQTAVAYARERLQGRSASGSKSPDKAADSLLVHPDVRRMLLTMKAFNEGGRALYMYIGKWLDLAKYGEEEVRQHADVMVALMTPVSKAYMTDMALQSAILGQQVLGGHGYVREWGQEQHVRDIRITQIYEGTNGIQAMDLIGRKTVATKGEYLNVFIEDVNNFIEQQKDHSAMADYLEKLTASVALLQEATDDVLQQSSTDPEAPGAAAVDYLELFGYTAYAYMWAMIVSAAQRRGDDAFARNKIATADFFFTRLLPQAHSLRARIAAGSDVLMRLPDDGF